MTPGRVLARFKQAEILTKEWVMGVRRGWLKVMSPTIHDWDDVQRAFVVLDQFLNNLSDQVFYARRGPYSGAPSMTEGTKLLGLFEQVREQLKDAKRKAQHWQDVKEGRSLPGFKVEDSDTMLALFGSNFAEATSFALQGRGGKWYRTTVTDLMDLAFKILREDAQRIKAQPESDPYQDTSVFKEFDLYGMKVVVDDRTALPGDIKGYIKFLDEAYQRLKQKGFAKAWYGTVFIQCESCGGDNQYGVELGVGGRYSIGKDTVQIYERPNRHTVLLMVHELGHRFWFKQMSSTQRAKFESLVRAHKNKKPQYDAQTIPRSKLQEGHKAVDAAVEPLRKVLKEFSASRLKWWRDIIEKFNEPIFKAAWQAQQDILTAMHLPGARAAINEEVKGLFNDALKYNSAVYQYAEGLDRAISDEVHKEPEVTTAPADIDKYWLTVFKKVQAKWVEEFEQKIEWAITGAYIYMDAAVLAWNEAEQETEKRLMKNWQESWDTDERSVLPVSDYGRSHIDEAWAEVFAHYVLGKDMTRDQIESFRSVLSSKRVGDRYRQARTKTIDTDWVEKLRKDFLTLMKNLPRVTDYKSGAVLREGFQVFHRNFKEWVYDEFLNPLKEEGRTNFEGIRKPAWDFYIELSLPLGYPDEYYSEEARFRSFEEEKRTWEQRLRTKAQAFWKVLKEALSYTTDQKVEYQVADEDQLVLEGFQVKIIGYDPSSSWQGDAFAKFKESLRQYRRKAAKVLPWLLQKQLPLEITFVGKLNEGGLYKGDHISIAMSAVVGEPPEWGVHMLAHEMGHHLYAHLDGKAKTFWDTAIRQDYGPIDLRELLAKWSEDYRWTSDMVDDLKGRDPILALQLDVLSRENGGRSGWEERERFQRALDSGEKTVAVPKHPITGYAGKNPEESFCEAIGRLVGYGPATVLSIIKGWLEIVIPGKVKTASIKRFSDLASMGASERLLQRYKQGSGVPGVGTAKPPASLMAILRRCVSGHPEYNYMPSTESPHLFTYKSGVNFWIGLADMKTLLRNGFMRIQVNEPGKITLYFAGDSPEERHDLPTNDMKGRG